VFKLLYAFIGTGSKQTLPKLPVSNLPLPAFRPFHCVFAACSNVAMAEAMMSIVVKPTAGGAKFSVSEVVSTMTIAELKEKVRLGPLRS